jgi:hypothetical protein
MAANNGFSDDRNQVDFFDNSNYEDIFNYSKSCYITENKLENFMHPDNKASLNIIHINCRSLNKNFDSITNLLYRTNCSFTAIGLCETWLSPITQDTFNIEGYQFVCRSRCNKIGGGVGLFINAAYNFQVRTDLSFMKDYIESIFVEISQENSANIVIGCIYRPPNSDVALFNIEVLQMLNILNKNRKILTFIMGDFNLNLLNSDSHAPTNDFLNNLMSHSFLPAIHHPTRITATASTLLDNIFSNNMKYKMESAILYSDISDHLPVLINVDLKLCKGTVSSSRSSRMYNIESIELFKHALSCTDWDDICHDSVHNDPSDVYDVFIDRFSNIFNDYFPQRTVKLKKVNNPRSDWITSGLIRSCNKKSILYKRYIKNPNSETKKKYISYRNKLKTVLKKAEKEYYKNKFSQLKGNLTQTWKLIGTIINKNKRNSTIVKEFIKDGSKITDPQEIVDHFNNLFVHIGDQLAQSIPRASTSFSSYLNDTESYRDSFVLFPTDAAEIIQIVNGLNDKSSYGIDQIPINIMKKCITHVAEPLSALINSSFRLGRVPDSLKIARVCPIFKSEADNIFSNYRPISVLPSFSKVFEKVVHCRLSDYINLRNVLCYNQYGFRQNHSTYMAIQDMYNKISKAIDDHEYAIGIFVDLSKAFDTINHDILLRKLEHYGVRGIALEWFRDYLSNRKQYVYFNNVSSNLMDVTCGVPQGSILGPLLFILYVNDIVNCSNVLYFILFANDTNIFYANNNHNDLMNIVNSELRKLSEWFKANKLSLNIKKTHYIIFKNRKKSCFESNFHIAIENNILERVSVTKFLGVFVDEDLNWKYHTSQIALKISKNIGVINRIKYLLTHDVLLSLYYTMIHPYLLYCNIIWVRDSQLALHRPSVLQKRAVRLIACSSYRAPSSPLFKQFGVLKLYDIRKPNIPVYVQM